MMNLTIIGGFRLKSGGFFPLVVLGFNMLCGTGVSHANEGSNLVAATAGAEEYSSSGDYSTKTAPFSPNDDVMLILSLNVGRYKLSDGVIAYDHSDGVLLSLAEFTATLEFPIIVSPDGQKADGWFIRENKTFSLNLASQSLYIEGQKQPFPSSGVHMADGEIFVTVHLLAKWFQLEIETNRFQSTLFVTSQEPLPFEAELARGDKQARVGGGRGEVALLPLKKHSGQLLGMPSAQISTSSNFTRGQSRPVTSYTGHFRAALLNHRANVVVTGVDDQVGQPRMWLERYDHQGELLGLLQARQYTLGNINSFSKPLMERGIQQNGVFVTNELNNLQRNFDKISLVGDLPLGWEAELYRNGQLIDFRKTGIDGQYEFTDISLDFGDNIFRVVLYGPQGQRRERIERYDISNLQVPKGQLRYSFDAGVPDRRLLTSLQQEEFLSVPLAEQIRGTLNLAYGLTPRLTLEGRYMTYFEAGKRQHLLGTGFSFNVLGMQNQIDVVHQTGQGEAVRAASFFNIGRTNFRFEHVQRFRDYTVQSAELGNRKSKSSAVIRGYLPGILSRIGYDLSAGREENQDLSRNWFFGNRIFANFSAFSFSNTIDYRFTTQNQTSRPSDIQGNLLINYRFSEFQVRGTARYQVRPDATLNSLDMQVEYGRQDSFLVRASVLHQMGVDKRTEFGLSLASRMKALALSLRGTVDQRGNYSLSLNLSTAIGWEPISKRYHMSSTRGASAGALSARVFMDVNSNDVFDGDDQLLEGVRLRVSGRVIEEKTNAEGVVYIANVRPFNPVNVEVDTGSLIDPYWIPVKKGWSFVPLPGETMNFNFPIATTGEIEGSVYLQQESKPKPVSAVRVQLLNTKGEVIMEEKSEYDGFYLFSFVPVGTYRIRLVEEQLKDFGLTPPPEKNVVLTPKDSVALGYDMIIKR